MMVRDKLYGSWLLFVHTNTWSDINVLRCHLMTGYQHYAAFNSKYDTVVCGINEWMRTECACVATSVTATANSKQVLIITFMRFGFSDIAFHNNRACLIGKL